MPELRFPERRLHAERERDAPAGTTHLEVNYIGITKQFSTKRTAMSRSVRDRDNCGGKHEGQEDKPKRKGLRRSRAKRDDAPKGENDGVGVEGIFPTPTATRPGTMSVIPTPGIPTVPSSKTTKTTRHPIFTGKPTPPSPTTTRRTGFFASGRPHTGGDWGRPNNNFFRPHHRNGGSPPALPPYAVALIAFGVLFIILGTIATTVCCRASAKRRNQNISTTPASKSAKSAFGDDGDDTESMVPVSVRDLPITKVPELEGTPRTESRYGPLGPVIPELHDQLRPSELR
ncbi:hypothetical protein PG996_016116 [Apiospora saccharicola]|uniref:Uncharacterized protein n=1 Tax=Apiospora saccharicola TaxID=335842 RepID=A0ABR1TNL7_9PEZI